MPTEQQIVACYNCVVRWAGLAILGREVAPGTAEFKQTAKDLSTWLGIGETDLDDVIEGYAISGKVLDMSGNPLPKLESIIAGGKCEIQGAGQVVSTAGRTVMPEGVAWKALTSAAQAQQSTATQLFQNLSPEGRTMALRAQEVAAEEKAKQTQKTTLMIGAAALAALLLLR